MTQVATNIAVLILVFLGSLLSGTFGSAGGTLLLGSLLAVLTVAEAMSLYSVSQLTSTVSRVVLWRHHVKVGLIAPFVLGGASVAVICRFIELLPSKALIYILLGIVPFVTLALPAKILPDIERPHGGVICGGICAALLVVAGSPGPIFDVFFQTTRMTRQEIIANKSLLQSISQLTRFVYFGSFFGSVEASLPLWIYFTAVALSLGGTFVASVILHKMDEAAFRRHTRTLIQVISATFVVRGLMMLASTP
jgi:uncharacterized membrane protein YfcA